jgi:hypothetical protein
MIKKKLKIWSIFGTLTLLSIACRNQADLENQFWNSDPSDSSFASLVGDSLSSESGQSESTFLVKPSYGINGSWRLTEAKHQGHPLFEESETAPTLEIKDHTGTIILSPTTYSLRHQFGCLLKFSVNLEFAGDVADLKIVKSDSDFTTTSECRNLTAAEMEEEQRFFEFTFLSNYDYELNLEAGILVLLDKEHSPLDDRVFQFTRNIEPSKGTSSGGTSGKSRRSKKSSKTSTQPSGQRESSRSSSTKNAPLSLKTDSLTPSTQAKADQKVSLEKPKPESIESPQQKKPQPHSEKKGSQNSDSKSLKPSRANHFLNEIIQKMIVKSQTSFLQKHPEQAKLVFELQSQIQLNLLGNSEMKLGLPVSLEQGPQKSPPAKSLEEVSGILTQMTSGPGQNTQKITPPVIQPE